MAEITSVKFGEDGIFLRLKISKEEYDFFGPSISELLIVPADSRSMDKLFTTGKLGNSTRLMLPKKAMERLDVTHVEKKISGRVFRLNGGVYMLARIHETKKKEK